MLKIMLVSIKWLNEFITCNKSAQELADLFTLKGIEVKSISRVGKVLEGFVVTEVKVIDKNNLTVSDGKTTYTFSTVTYHLKQGDKIGFNFQTNQWLNPQLIGLSEDALPYVLEKDYETGKPVLDYLDDEVIELEILPNRGDLMSMLGIARELSSYKEIEQSLHISTAPKPIDSDKYFIADLLELQVLDSNACPDYIARMICDVKISASPFWLQWRLLAVGLRPINNIVDATNYMMVKYGTPLHAFDYDKVTDQTIQVRFANKNEKIRTIDNNLHSLNEKVLLIADKKFPIALAGIMGGLTSEISFNTKRVLIECARFNPQIVRRGSKSINLSSEASQRFEMGIDSEILETASEEVSILISQLSNGIVAQGKLESRTQDKPITISLSYTKTNRLLGLSLSAQQIKNILIKLNCHIEEKGDSVLVETPSYRFDLARDVDLVEEIGRIHGYDKLESVFSLRGNRAGQVDKLSRQFSQIRNFFIGLGFVENYSISFCDELTAKLFTSEEIVRIPNPLNERYSALRPSILATLLDCVRINYSRGNKNLRLFEIGKVFAKDKDLSETVHITALLTGEAQPLFWRHNDESTYDYFDVKGITESFLDYLKIKEISFNKIESHFLNKNAMHIKYADKEIGYLGELNKTVLDKFDIPAAVYVMNLDLAEILKLAPSYRFYQALPRFPSVVRDFALVIDDSFAVQQLTSSVEKITGALLQSVEIFDYFGGKPLPPGKRNLGIRIALQSEERTLQQAEVNKIFDKILEYITEKWHVQIR
ncbi:MAG: phenylalanine--tRNA ligase subunit beta [Candidatus Latescibacteria bacterium]|nr:phenylalanine--tRNA ligase subunit beta [Candidatus Latescibacterota bacterium]